MKLVDDLMEIAHTDEQFLYISITPKFVYYNSKDLTSQEIRHRLTGLGKCEIHKRTLFDNTQNLVARFDRLE